MLMHKLVCVSGFMLFFFLKKKRKKERKKKECVSQS